MKRIHEMALLCVVIAATSAGAADGWCVMATERKMKVAYGHTLVAGRCDRIDFNERTGEWCVVDYKTWDSAASSGLRRTRPNGGGISPTGSSTPPRKASTRHGSPTSSAGLKLAPGLDASDGSVLGFRRFFVRRLG